MLSLGICWQVFILFTAACTSIQRCTKMGTSLYLSSVTGISHLKVPYESHSSEIWVDLAKFYELIKDNHSENDKSGVPRRNNFYAEIKKYAHGVEERKSSTYITVGAVLRYCFSHTDTRAVCKHIVDETTKALTYREPVSDVQRDSVNGAQDVTTVKTQFQLYKEISSFEDLVCIWGKDLKDLHFEDHKIETIDISYRSAFLEHEWKRIQLFEFQYSAMEKDKRKHETSSEYAASPIERKWSFWDSIKMGMTFGHHIQKISTRVCSYQKDRMDAAEAIEGVSVLVGSVQHLPRVLEEIIRAGIFEYKIVGIDKIISVDFSDIFGCNDGIHVFIEADPVLIQADFQDLSTIVRASLRNHVEIQQIVYLKPNALSQFITDTEVARFTMRDMFLLKRLNDEILHMAKSEDDSNTDRQDEARHQLCSVCYKNYSDWLEYPLSIASHDQLNEWLLFVPLPVRLFLEKAFLNANSLKYSLNAVDLIRSKVPRLSTIYEACLNTFNKNYFGPSQEMNTAELIVNYHNATTVFGITQSSGISMSLISAEKKLKKQSDKERLYFHTYLKQHPLEFEALTDTSVQPHAVSMRDCHLIFLVDNLVRTQKKRDPESGRMKSIQLCTLPITVKGLPRNSKVTDSWHSDTCDGSDNCSCKDGTQIPKNDIFDTFLLYTQEEETQIQLFRQEAIWGMGLLLQDTMVRPIMDAAAEIHKPLIFGEAAADDLTISFHDLSLQEVEGIEDKELEKSISGLSLGESDGAQDNYLHGFLHDSDDLTQVEVEEEEEEEVDDENEEEEEGDDDDGQNEFVDDISDSDVDSYSSLSNLDSDHDQSDGEVLPTEVELFQIECLKDQQAESPEAHKGQKDIYQPEFEFNSNTDLTLEINMEGDDIGVSSLTTESNVSSFVKYDVPTLLCRHPPPAIGKDDDIRVLRNVLDEVIVKSGHFMHPKPNKEKILLAPDHKIANNVFRLMEEQHFSCLLPEFPVLHLLKSKITNLISAYEPAGIRGLLKYMKDDDEESDWKKLVSLAEIESAARNIRRLSLSLHIAIFSAYVQSLTPIESDNLLEDLKCLSPKEAEQRWGRSYDMFTQKASANNATFRLHIEIMNHCDEIVGIQLAERIGGSQGYNLLLALVKSTLPFSFLNGASSYAGFCVKLLYEHYRSSFFHKRMKESLFTTPHKDYETNFALDAQREMDHRDAIKSFRSSASIESILPRMSVMDELQAIRKVRSSIYKPTSEKPKVKQQAIQYLGKTISDKDLRFVSRCAQMILRKNVLSTENDNIPQNMYQKNPQPLSVCILDSETEQTGHYLVKKYICNTKLGGKDTSDCPDVKGIQGPTEIIQKVKMSKGTTIQRRRIKANAQKTEKEVIEEKRLKEMKKLNKLTMHCSSVMNTCQAIVNPDCSKPDSNKSKGMRDSIAYVLSRRKEHENPPPPKETVAAMAVRRSRQLQEDGLIYFQCSTIPTTASKNVKVVTVEFAGVKFWASAKSGREFLNLIQKALFSTIFKDFRNANHIIICEEKYSFTPNTFKALTREKREKTESVDISHLKTNEEMLSLETFSKSALIRTNQGKKLASSFLAANIKEIKLDRKCTIDIDSEFLLSECLCSDKLQHQTTPCKQHAIPLQAIFGDDGGLKETKQITTMRQRKGEAELAQADWLPFIVPDLEEGDAVLGYVTSGDIDALPIHILAVSEYWPRLPNKKFKNDVFLLLKKPKKDMKPDLYCITKIVETLEIENTNPDIGVIVAFVLCIGGNDYIPKFHGISHLQWMKAIVDNNTYCDNLFLIKRQEHTRAIESISVNEEVYVRILKDLYCPKKLRSGKLTYEEVRQMSIKLPGKEVKIPQQWLPPLSAIQKVLCLIQSQLDYLLTVCKPEADLPDFLGNGGLRRTKEGDIVYDLGEDVRYNIDSELTTIPEDVLQEKIDHVSVAIRQGKKKRDLSESPQKEDSHRGAKRIPSTSTPRKIKDLRRKQRQQMTVSERLPDHADSDEDDMFGFQQIDEGSEEI